MAWATRFPSETSTRAGHTVNWNGVKTGKNEPDKMETSDKTEVTEVTDFLGRGTTPDT